MPYKKRGKEGVRQRDDFGSGKKPAPISKEAVAMLSDEELDKIAGGARPLPFLQCGDKELAGSCTMDDLREFLRSIDTCSQRQNADQ